LKPGNVLVDAGGRPKVIDFGVAKATECDIQLTTMRTDVGQLIGTLAYMSPEQAIGDSGGVDTRSDVYALGVLLFELLSGRAPQNFRGCSIADAARIISEDDPARLSSIDTSFRGDIETIVAKALEKSKDRRYQSAASLSEDIERFLGDEPILARPASAAYRVRKFSRRHKGLVGGAVLAFVALAVGMVMTTKYAIEARRQAAAATLEAERASRRFDQVRQLARTFIFDFHDRIEDLPGATETRRFLVATALNYLGDLAEESPDEPELLAELAEAYEKIGDVQGKPNSPNLGDTEGAMESFRKSIAIRTRLCESDPRNIGWRAQLALNHASVGNLYREMGNNAKALAEFRTYRDIVEPIYESDPKNPRYQQWMSFALNQLGKIPMSEGRLDEAMVAFEESLAFRLAVAKSTPYDVRRRREVTVGYEKIGDVHNLRRNFDEALTNFEMSYSIRAEIARANPRSLSAQRDLGFTLGRIGNTLLSLGRTDDALAKYLESQAIREVLAEADLNNKGAQSDLAVGMYRIGVVHLRLEQWAEALSRFERFVQIEEALFAADPRRIGYHFAIGEGRFFVGEAQLGLGAVVAARAAYETSLAVYDELTAANPDSSEGLHGQAITHERLAMLDLDAGAIEEGARSLMSSVDILARLEEFEILEAQVYVDVARACVRVGLELISVRDDGEQSREWFDRGAAILDRVPRDTGVETAIADIRRDLASVSTDGLGVHTP
jgi:eukaryotic-like serine/threonine-protein kinase